MNMDGANETTVRAVIADPFLAALGYAWGTPNDIQYEYPLAYAREILGRKKKSDPPLRGIPDYVLSVLGAGRWVLETKPATESIGADAFAQVLSYARHPEVSASYAAVLNGLRLTVHHTSQHANEPPRVDLPVEDPHSLAEMLKGLLSPAAIRRDCSPPVVDLGKPLADGLRSTARVIRGEIRNEESSWSCNQSVPLSISSYFDEACRRLTGMRFAVTGGRVYRDKTSRIRTTLTWSMPHDQLVQFALDKQLMDVEYLALSDTISSSPERPTLFEFVGAVKVNAGEQLFDVSSWTSKLAGVPVHMTYGGHAAGYMDANVFLGSFVARYHQRSPSLPGFEVTVSTKATFDVELDPR